MANFGRATIYQSASAPNPPNANNDSTQGFDIGSDWTDTNTGVVWNCVSNSTGAARWQPEMIESLLGRLIGADMNVTTDQTFSMNIPLLVPFTISKILATNASIDLTAADGGIYDAAAKGGNAIVANTQVYTALTTSSKLLSLTIAAAGSGNVFQVAPILSLTGAQGEAATCDFYLIGNVLAYAP